jgi:NitT/TauT family transport system substrate-binding protein
VASVLTAPAGKKKSAGHSDHWINSVERLAANARRAGGPESGHSHIRRSGRRHRRNDTGWQRGRIGPTSSRLTGLLQPTRRDRAGRRQGPAERQPRLLIDCSDFIRHNDSYGVPTSWNKHIRRGNLPLGVMLMRANRTIVARCILASLASLLGLASLGAADENRQPIAIQFSFDRPINASVAPFILAAGDGLFASEGLAVTTDVAGGSPNAIARVAAGASEFALVDINALIRFRDRDAPPVKAVFVLFNKSPYAIVARKSRGIRVLSDIEGKTLGVADGDLSLRLWPALAHQNGIKIASVKENHMSAAVREPMLSAGQVDAVTGFSYLAAVNLRDRGVPADDLAVLRFSDYGCEAYGFAVIVNPAFAARRPEAVKGFLRAVIAGTNLAIRAPGHAVDEVLSRMDDGARDLELARLQTVIDDNILTGEVKRNGIGGVDTARLDRSIDQVGEDFKFSKRPSAADIFDGGFLPPLGGRLIN